MGTSCGWNPHTADGFLKGTQKGCSICQQFWLNLKADCTDTIKFEVMQCCTIFLGNFQNFIYCISSFAVAVPGCASICWSRSTGLKFKLTSSSLSWQFVLKTNSGYPIELPLKSKWDPIPQRHHKILGCTGNLSSADHGISGDPCVGSPPWSCGKDQSLPLGRCASAFCPIQTHLIWTCGLR